MWGEKVDASDFDQTVWPRLAAIAEKLWSPAAATGAAGGDDLPAALSAALPRLQAFRCLLNERGVASAPVTNQRAREAPKGPDSCYNQRRLL